MRRAGRISGLITATVMWGATAAHAVAVSYSAEDFSVNVGLLLRAGHYYTFAEPNKEYLDSSSFGVTEAELATFGHVFKRVSYDFRVGGFSHVREAWAAVDLPGGFSAKIGEQFVPFGVEATTPEGYLTCSTRTESSYNIGRGRDFGLRFNYLHEADDWPYEIGAAAGVFNNADRYGYPLVDGAWRVYGTPAPGVRTLEVGCSFYYGKELRPIEIGQLVDGYYYFSAPRLGFDVTYDARNFNLAAEYMQYFIRQYYVGTPPRSREHLFKDDYYRGYFATLGYLFPLPYKYVNSIRPYARYEHYKPAVIRRGRVAENNYTGGFSTFFFDRVLMFRADYTRKIEEKNRTTNDRIASEFQVMF